MKRPIRVENSIEYEQCISLNEIKKAIRKGTYLYTWDHRSFRKTFRELVSEFFRGRPYYVDRR